jgi:hypothetical protein
MGGKENPFCQRWGLFNGDHENQQLQKQSLKEFRAGEKERTISGAVPYPASGA